MKDEHASDRRTETDRAYDREESLLVGLVILLSITMIMLGVAWLLLR